MVDGRAQPRMGTTAGEGPWVGWGKGRYERDPENKLSLLFHLDLGLSLPSSLFLSLQISDPAPLPASVEALLGGGSWIHLEGTEFTPEIAGSKG